MLVHFEASPPLCQPPVLSLHHSDSPSSCQNPLCSLPQPWSTLGIRKEQRYYLLHWSLSHPSSCLCVSFLLHSPCPGRAGQTYLLLQTRSPTPSSAPASSHWAEGELCTDTHQPICKARKHLAQPLHPICRAGQATSRKQQAVIQGGGDVNTY